MDYIVHFACSHETVRTAKVKNSFINIAGLTAELDTPLYKGAGLSFRNVPKKWGVQIPPLKKKGEVGKIVVVVFF